MRKKNSLSTFAMAALIAVLSYQITLAQTGGGFAPQQTQPTYVPKAPDQGPAVQPVGYQEEIKVPEILSGKTNATPVPVPAVKNAGAIGTVTPQQPAEMKAAPTPQFSPAEFQPQTTTADLRTPATPGDDQSSMIGTPKQAQTVPVQPIQSPAGAEVQQVSATEALNSLRDRELEAQAANRMEPYDTNDVATIEPSPVTSTIPQARTSAGLTVSEGPKLRVTSNGPASITIGKPARFEVTVENLESRSANTVIVGVNFPEWVDVTSVMPSTGSKEMTGDSEEPLLVWQIPIVEANTTEKVTIEVIPREARPFDIDVEWTFKPIRGKTTVEVTQPQLSLQIAGPTEVQFGEKALYDVTVSNPGTGTADNVIVMLPEVLGGERAKLDNILPQQQKKFQVELIARSAGTLDLTTTVVADGDLKKSDTREIIVRRAVLNVKLDGPPMKYAGSIATYQITVSNQGDAMAREVVAAVALPPGVEFLSGIDNAEKIDGGIRWNVGMLSPGNQRTYQMSCNMKMAGDITVDAATRGLGDLAATDSAITKVDAVADLVLAVADPKGPLPTGENIEYQIRITNRGTKAARVVNVVMHFSEGVEPKNADGIPHELAPGQVTFAPISQIEPGQDVILKVIASANQPGSHRFRAQLLCDEADSHEVAEGTTRFFGEATAGTPETADNENSPSDGSFKR